MRARGPVVLSSAALCPPGPPRAGWVVIQDGLIIDVGEGRNPRGALDLGDALLAPGFLDLQVNGVAHTDMSALDTGGWREAGRVLAAHGVTSCCPTLVTAPLAEYDAMLSTLAEIRDETAAEDLPSIIGVHLEGPFLGSAPGAHRAEWVRPVDLDWLVALIDAHPSLVRIVTLSPEADPGLHATRSLASRGVTVALGHSRASYEECRAAAAAGARLVTHLFNAMDPLHHRAPGLVGAAFDDERLTPTLIADLVHVHPAVVRLAIRAKASISLVSDLVAARGTDRERGGAIRRDDGLLVGASTTLDRAVANVVALGFPVERAVGLASTVPAAVLGLADRGRLEPGTRADLVAMDPTTWSVRETWICGTATGGGI